ncbi:hypothetical protein Dimus_010187, partial [Dionaea muscipula]
MVGRGRGVTHWRETPVCSNDSESLTARCVLVVRQSPSSVPPRSRRAPPSPGPHGCRDHRPSSPMRLYSSDPNDFSSSEEGDSTEAIVTSSEDEELRDPEGGRCPHSHVPELSPIKEIEASISGSMSASPTIEAVLRPKDIEANGVEAGLTALRCPDLVSSRLPSLLIDGSAGSARLDLSLVASLEDDKRIGSPVVGGDAVRLTLFDGCQQHPLPPSKADVSAGQFISLLTGGEQQVGMRLGSPCRAGRQSCPALPVNGRLQQGSGRGVVVGGSRNSFSRTPQLHWPSLRVAARPRVDGAAPKDGSVGAPLGGCEDRYFAFVIGGDRRADIPLSFVPPQITSD